MQYTEQRAKIRKNWFPPCWLCQGHHLLFLYLRGGRSGCWRYGQVLISRGGEGGRGDGCCTSGYIPPLVYSPPTPFQKIPPHTSVCDVDFETRSGTEIAGLWLILRTCCKCVIHIRKNYFFRGIYSMHRLPECLSLRRNWSPPPQASVFPPLDPKEGGGVGAQGIILNYR